jgi:hypothetical protein
MRTDSQWIAVVVQSIPTMPREALEKLARELLEEAAVASPSGAGRPVHETAAALKTALVGSSGKALGELKAATGFSTAVVRRGLGVLIEAGEVVMVGERRFARYSLQGEASGNIKEEDVDAQP